MVQDRKAIQAGTSHYLGQNFAKAQNITFAGRDGTVQHVHTTSWGVSTRLVGTLIMAHADDDGLVLPPRVAPQQIVILPVTPKPEGAQAIIDACQALAETLRHQSHHGEPLRVLVDTRDLNGGVKKWEWIKKGVPLRVELGPRDIASRKVCLQRRDQPAAAKEFIDKEDFIRRATEILDEVHGALLEKNRAFRDANIKPCASRAEFDAHWQQDDPGWLLTPWAGTAEQEEELSKQFKISIRCLPLDRQDDPEAPCFLTGTATRCQALWGRSY
jgi:prolyl-tRNA synthetase